MFGLFRRKIEQKVSQAYALHFGPNKAAWSPRNYDSFVKEGYKMNVVAFSAINRIADAVATLEWQVWNGDEIIRDGHPYLDLVKRPNPTMSGAEWWRAKICYLMLNGNAYDELVVGERGRPVEIWPLRPDRMEILPGRTGLPRGYVYKVNQSERRFPADPITGESPIRHTKLFNPVDDWYGMSPVQAGAYAIDQHNQSMNWIQSLLGNSARPSGALVVKEEVGLSDEEFQRLKQQVEDHYSGSENAGRPMLLEGGMDWKQMALSPMDMEILKTKESSARDIALAFGVPPLLLNIPGDNTYSNFREARLGFYEDTILPLVRYETEQLNRWLSPYYEGVELRPNIEAIEAIAEKRERMWQMANESDDITLNESRKMKGLDPIEGPMGDMLMSEIRSMQKRGADEGEPDQDVQDSLKELAYGTR